MKASVNKWIGVLAIVALLCFGVGSVLLAATTGKIAGRVVDKENGEPLPGANVTVVGTSLGAATNANGEYFILNVPPGVYSVRAQMIGYTAVTQTNVHVSINLTTTVDFAGDFALPQQAVAGQEVTVVSQRPVVQPDVSANIANVSAVELENVPVLSVRDAIDLQAGIEPGLIVRGGGLDQLSFTLDGISLRDGRDNQPFTGISYTAIEEFQVQTGGFNAEYGNVRSGLVNVVTKDGDRNRYAVDALMRYRPNVDYNFGPGVKDKNAYWWRPYTDPDVALVGTENGPWDRYTRRQYPKFDGWNTVSEGTLADEDPSNDLTVQNLQDIFAWHHRKDTEVSDPRYEADVTVSGPVPLVSKALGDMRFVASYRGTQEPYFYPQARSSYQDKLVQGKITTDLAANMKLSLQGLWSQQTGMAHGAFATVTSPNPQRGGIPVYSWSNVANGPQTMVNNNADHVGRSVLFGTDRYAITDVDRFMLGGTFTHTLNPSTFYQVSLQRMETDYRSHPSRRRSGAIIKTIGTMGLDESPFGWTSQGTSNPGSGLRLGGHWARARDTSNVAVTTGRFDITSQLNRVHQFKAGVEVIYNDYNMNYGSDDSVIVHLERSKQRWTRQPIQGAAYIQDKLEFKGMIANIGVRLDYFDPKGDWWVFSPFERAFNAKSKNVRNDLLETTSTDKQVTLSPRLGVSFPISVNSKLYFNYGHFRQMMTSRDLFQIETQWLGNIGNLGNPNLPLQRTVAYELGYDHNLFNQYLLRVSGYYRDTDNQPSSIQFVSIDGEVNYNINEPLNYNDVRGFELTLSKRRGDWLRGFVNYTFHQWKGGNFGFRQQNENVIDQRAYERTTTDHYQDKPVSQPFATFNVEFITPNDFGPEVSSGHPLADIRVDFLGSWRAGQAFTWAGPSATIPGLQNNIRMKDFWSLDLRLSKNIKAGTYGRAQFFLDINNVLNIKQLYFSPFNPYGGPFEGDQDWEDYMKSLHISESAFEDIDIEKDLTSYTFIPGNDKPGDYRDYDASFVPIEIVADQASLPDDPGFLEEGRRVLYWLKDTQAYMEYVNGSWQNADAGFVNKVLDDKSYIDMPNERDRAFLNPRSVIFGIRFSF